MYLDNLNSTNTPLLSGGVEATTDSNNTICSGRFSLTENADF